jgi:chemotaxis protein methyltransferase CheR
MNPPATVAQKEFLLTDEDFRAIRDIVHTRIGINLDVTKRELVYGRLARRLRALGLPTFAAYRAYLDSPAGEHEFIELTNAVTTNLTSFFREEHHFDYLREYLAARTSSPASAGHRLRIWCAAASTGEEPYSIAMTVAEAMPDWARRDIRILATDIDTAVLSHAEQGIYSADRFGSMAVDRRERFFNPVWHGRGPHYQVKSELAQMISFRRLNLIEPLPMKGPLDAIFCRNVIIYFDKTTQGTLFRRIAPLQPEGALLFLGHSETLHGVSGAWSLIGKTIYRKKAP